MKKQLLTLSLLLSTTTFSSLSFGEWELATISSNDDTFFWDKDRVRVRGGLVYWYGLTDFLKPEQGYLSLTEYSESDCQRMSVTILSLSMYKQAMGRGEPELTHNYDDDDIRYLEPGSAGYIRLSAVCDYVNSN